MDNTGQPFDPKQVVELARKTKHPLARELGKLIPVSVGGLATLEDCSYLTSIWSDSMQRHPGWYTGAEEFLDGLEHSPDKQVWYGGFLGAAHTVALALNNDRSQIVAAFICRPKD